MGWLRALMGDAEPPIASFGRLASECLASSEWPDHVRSQPRSLSALFSKLDRDIELEWLDDRPEVQRVLASVLSCSSGEIARPLKKILPRREAQHGRWRLPSPSARPLDLQAETLPPGLPPELEEPGSWQRLFWPTVAHDAALVAHWLEARGLAWCGSLDQLTEGRPPADQPLFVTSDTQQPDLSLLRTRRHLVASTTAAPCPPGWTLVRNPPSEQWRADLVGWLGARLAGDGRYVPEVANDQLRQAAQWGLLDSLDTALGLAAACAELAEPAPGRSVVQLAQDFLHTRLSRSDVSARLEARWLVEHGFRALTGLVQAALAQFGERWNAARSEQQWQLLVPGRYQHGLDADWVRASLERSGQLSAEQLEAVLERSPPGAFRLVRAFEAAGVLSGVEQLRLEPRWLALVAKHAAEQDVLRRDASEWGKLLLEPSSRQSLRRHIAADLRGGGRILEALLAMEPNARDAPFVLALETLFELTGAALLEGLEFDVTQLAALWEGQAELWLTLDAEQVVPRLVASAFEPARLGAWLLSAWAISEQLEGAAGMAGVTPWVSPGDVPASALDAVEAYLQQLASSSDTTTPACLGGYALVMRLFAGQPHLPDHPLTLLPRAVHAHSWSDLQALHLLAGAGDVLQQLLGDGFGSFADRAWQYWLAAGGEGGRHCLSPSEPIARRFWPHLPTRIAAKLVEHDHPFIRDIPFDVVSESVFGLLLLALHELPAEAYEHLPEPLLSSAIETLSRRDEHLGLSRLWRRFPTALLHELTLLLEAEQWDVIGPLLQALPCTTAHGALNLVRRRLDAFGVMDPLALVARPWLQAMAAEDHPARVDAYVMLAEIEHGMNRLRHGSS